MWARGGGRHALTEYEVAEEWGPLTLLRVDIHTGRTHQIRVHLSELGVGILNDFKYGQGANRGVRNYLKRGITASAPRVGARPTCRCTVRTQCCSCPRVPRDLPHAAELRFAHPQTGQVMQFSSRKPRIWEEVREQVDC